MKFSASLFLLAALSLTACNNLVTRRDLYSPSKASGPYTQARRTGKLPAADATPGPAISSSAASKPAEEANLLPQ